MRFEFLGTGTSAGIPSLACACAVCTSTDPRDNRLRTSAALTWTDPAGHDRTAILDCGPDFRQQALRARLRRLDAVLFTHNHVDHTFGLDEVRRFNAVQKAPIDVYAEDHTLGFLRRVYTHIFDPTKNINDSFVATLIAHRIQPAEPIDVHGVTFTPIRLLHGRLPIVGFRIDPPPPSPHSGSAERSEGGARGAAAPSSRSGSAERGEGNGEGPAIAASPPPTPRPQPRASPFPLAYCTDVSALPPEAWPALRGVRTLVLDALRHRHHPTHLTIDQAINIAQRVSADHTYFVHMSHDLAHEATQAQLPPGISLAYDGLILE